MRGFLFEQDFFGVYNVQNFGGGGVSVRDFQLCQRYWGKSGREF